MNQFSQIYYPHLDPYEQQYNDCLLYTSDAADEEDSNLHDPDYLNIAVFNGMYF